MKILSEKKETSGAESRGEIDVEGNNKQTTKTSSRKGKKRKVQEAQEVHTGKEEIALAVDPLMEKRAVEGVLLISAEVISAALDAIESVLPIQSDVSSDGGEKQSSVPPPSTILQRCLSSSGLTADQRERLASVETAVRK